MSTKPAEVSTFEAKTRFAELLRETEAGRSFIIRRRGKAVARLVPPTKETHKQEWPQILASFHEIRKRIRGAVKIRELIEEGRRG